MGMENSFDTHSPDKSPGRTIRLRSNMILPAIAQGTSYHDQVSALFSCRPLRKISFDALMVFGMIGSQLDERTS